MADKDDKTKEESAKSASAGFAVFESVPAETLARLPALKALLKGEELDRWGELGRQYREAKHRFTLSLRASNERILLRAQKLIADAVAGKRFSGKAEFVAEMRKLLGFPSAQNYGDRYNLSTVESDARLKLIYDTQIGRARAQVQRLNDIKHEVFDEFPAQELKRYGVRKQPRDWKKRWKEAGGKLYKGRMIALVDDPIWTKISRWGDPLPPYDYNSGMALGKISRADAIRLGVIKDSRRRAKKAPKIDIVKEALL